MSPDVQNLKDDWAESINNALSLYDVEDNIEVGILTLKPETRLPKEGYSVHEGSHEFAYVLDGEVVFVTKDKETKIKEGKLMYNQPGTEHFTKNETDKEARILWFVAPPL